MSSNDVNWYCTCANNDNLECSLLAAEIDEYLLAVVTQICTETSDNEQKLKRVPIIY